MSLLNKLFIAVLIVVSIVVISETASTAASNNSAVKFYTCDQVTCKKYNADGSAKMNTVYGVSWHSYVVFGARVQAKSVGNGWLKQTLFGSQSVYFIASNFK